MTKALLLALGGVSSMWEIQKNPYGGDAVNSYNDGPPQPGAKSLGPFYELETSSPAAARAPGGEPGPRTPDLPLRQSGA